MKQLKNNQPERFEIGKAYEHLCGHQIYITGLNKTILYGCCYIAENGRNPRKFVEKSDDEVKDSVVENGWSNNFSPISIGGNYSATANYFEIPVEQFKLDNFDLNKEDKIKCERVLKFKRILKENEEIFKKAYNSYLKDNEEYQVVNSYEGFCSDISDGYYNKYLDQFLKPYLREKKLKNILK